MSEKTELSEREIEILRLVATGVSNKEIAQQLFISTNTVKVHLRNIFSKIGVESRTEAAMYAVNNGFIEGSRFEPVGEQLQPVMAEPQVPIINASNQLEKRMNWLWIGIVSAIVFIVASFLFYSNQLAGTTQPTDFATSTEEARLIELASMPTPRSGLGVVVFEEQILAISGRMGSTTTGVVESFDVKANHWIKKTAKDVPVSDVQAVLLGGKIYLPGGRLQDGKPTDSLDIYDPREDRWSQGAHLPYPLSAYALTAFEGKLYLFGGWDGEKYLNSVFEYDPTEDHWKDKTPMSIARAFAGATVANGKIYVMGGFDGRQGLNINEIYEPGLDNGIGNPWRLSKPLPESRYSMGVTSIADVVYVVGGLPVSKNNVQGYFFVPQNENWQPVDFPDYREWSGLGMVPLGQKIYAVGGKINGEPTGRNISYQAIYLTVFPIIP